MTREQVKELIYSDKITDRELGRSLDYTFYNVEIIKEYRKEYADILSILEHEYENNYDEIEDYKWQRLHHLNELKISDIYEKGLNNFNGILPKLPKHIKKITVTGNCIKGFQSLEHIEIFSSIKCPNLKELPDMINCKIIFSPNSGLEKLGRLPNVQFLNISNPSYNISEELIYNRITELPELPKVIDLECSYNFLTTLPDLPKVVKLDCEFNKITHFGNLSEELKELKCNNNSIINIPHLPKLEKLYCRDNSIRYLPDLPKLMVLKCNRNELQKLPKLPNIMIIDCRENEIKNINLEEFPKSIQLSWEGSNPDPDNPEEINNLFEN